MVNEGPLEQRVLEVLWEGEELTVRQVLDALNSSHAYTTILTVLDRLHEKGRVQRRKKKRAWVYRPARPREAELGATISQLLGTPGVDSEPLLMAFLDSAESVDPEILQRLEQMIKDRRKKRA